MGSLTVQRLNYPCKDGFVCFTLFGGAAGADTNKRFTEWMDSEGMAPDFMKNKDWSTWDFATINQEELDAYEKPITDFLKKYTKQELFEQALKRRIMIYPISTAKDAFKDPQLEARDFWTEVEHPELNATLRYPGAFAYLPESPCSIRRRPPLIGEHNEEVYHKELKIPKKELILLKQNGSI